MTTNRSIYEEEVLRAARRYARMKIHGSYVENGGLVRVNHHDQKEYLDHFTKRLLVDAERLLESMAIDESSDGKLRE